MKLKIYSAILAIIFSLSFVLCINLTPKTQSFSYNNNVKYIAHRGYGELDNTQENFLNSINFDGIECDVHFTLDNVPIVNHDDSITFDDKSTKFIRETNYADLTVGTIYGGKEICDFETYLEICWYLNKIAVIEIKPQITDAQRDIILQCIDEIYFRSNCHIISFHQSNILKFKNQDIMLFLLVESNLSENVNFCIFNQVNISIKFDIISKLVITKLHRNNLKVGVWTITTAHAQNKALIFGVDYITSEEMF